MVSNNWETVEDRWIYAARGLASTELSFQFMHKGIPSPGQTMKAGVRKNDDFLHCGFE